MAGRSPTRSTQGHSAIEVTFSRGAYTPRVEKALSSTLRTAFPGVSWSAIRRMCMTGKVAVAGRIVCDPAHRVDAGVRIDWDAARPDPSRARQPLVHIVFEDGHLVVIDKPEGMSSVPYERREKGTALDAVREVWRTQGRHATAQPLYVVHRIDKDTSGLLCFAKTKLAERGLHQICKRHLAERIYFAVAHGEVQAVRICSRLVPDRGDGLRGSTRHAGVGQRAVTHVTIDRRLPGATLCRVRLETGRTHQIRIHLAERGHPLLGETVYIRDLRRAGEREIACPRLLLHAATLGFPHPVTGAPLLFHSPLPADYQAALSALEGSGGHTAAAARAP